MEDKGFPQKKVLSLVLCVAVMLSVMVMGAGAAFSDQDKIENTEAVDACSALNIIGGYEDGSYHPERNIKRSEITKHQMSHTPADNITIALQVSVFSLIRTNHLRNGLCHRRLLGNY